VARVHWGGAAPLISKGASLYGEESKRGRIDRRVTRDLPVAVSFSFCTEEEDPLKGYRAELGPGWNWAGEGRKEWAGSGWDGWFGGFQEETRESWAWTGLG
jgi:hypothetical protein